MADQIRKAIRQKITYDNCTQTAATRLQTRTTQTDVSIPNKHKETFTQTSIAKLSTAMTQTTLQSDVAVDDTLDIGLASVSSKFQNKNFTYKSNLNINNLFFDGIHMFIIKLFGFYNLFWICN